MVQELQNIKEQLFDAPSDIKKSYNKVAQYFEKHTKTQIWRGDAQIIPRINFTITDLKTKQEKAKNEGDGKKVELYQIEIQNLMNYRKFIKDEQDLQELYQKVLKEK